MPGDSSLKTLSLESFDPEAGLSQANRCILLHPWAQAGPGSLHMLEGSLLSFVCVVEWVSVHAMHCSCAHECEG